MKGTEFVDFEKINSLDGVFLANKLELNGKKSPAESGAFTGMNTPYNKDQKLKNMDSVK